MAERLPYVQQNRTVAAGAGHDAQEWRWSAAGASKTGVCGAGELKVSTGTGMQVTVAAGGAFVPDGTTPAGAYHVFNDAAIAVSVNASSPTQGRIDLIVAEVLDTAAGSAEDRFRIRAVAGTTSGSPVAPAVPARSLVLAEVSVPAAAVNVLAGHITDRRVAGGAWAPARGQVWTFDATALAGTLRQSAGEIDTMFTQSVPTVPGRKYSFGVTGVVVFDQASGGGSWVYKIGASNLLIWQGLGLAAGNSFAVNMRSSWTLLAAAATVALSATLQKTVGSGVMTIDSGFGPIVFAMYDEGGGLT
jgi:hypothetical protein